MTEHDDEFGLSVFDVFCTIHLYFFVVRLVDQLELIVVPFGFFIIVRNFVDEYARLERRIQTQEQLGQHVN